jgi:hypothetical protein
VKLDLAVVGLAEDAVEDDEVVMRVDVEGGAEDLTGTMPARSVDGVMLVANFGPAVAVMPGRAAFKLGTPDGGCLRTAGSPPSGSGAGAIAVSTGGTAVVGYDVAPGTVRVAAYRADDPSCGGAPVIGPVDAQVGATGRTYVIAYGTGPDDLRLLVVPSSDGP